MQHKEGTMWQGAWEEADTKYKWRTGQRGNTWEHGWHRQNREEQNRRETKVKQEVHRDADWPNRGGITKGPRLEIQTQKPKLIIHTRKPSVTDPGLRHSYLWQVTSWAGNKACPLNSSSWFLFSWVLKRVCRISQTFLWFHAQLR